MDCNYQIPKVGNLLFMWKKDINWRVLLILHHELFESFIEKYEVINLPKS